MKSVSALVIIVAAIFLAALPASAYVVTLDTWNVQQLQNSGDVVTVNITGSSATFTFVSGGGITNTFQAMFKIFFQPDVFSGGDSITGVPSPYSLSCGSASGGGSCQADGFLVNPAAAEYATPNGGPGKPASATFTFASALPSGLDKTDFDVHVTYSGSCSGFVDGTLKGSATSDTSCTPVPEPMTMFLGGTGLLALGYAARKRLFGGRLASAI